MNLSWRETAAKIAIRLAGYVDPGPLRPPFLESHPKSSPPKQSAPLTGSSSAKNTAPKPQASRKRAHRDHSGMVTPWSARTVLAISRAVPVIPKLETSIARS